MKKMKSGKVGSLFVKLVAIVAISAILLSSSAFCADGSNSSFQVPHNLSYLLSNTGDGYDILLNSWNSFDSSVTPPSNLSYLLSNTGEGYDALLQSLDQPSNK